MKFLFKLFNLLVMALIVFGALSWGIWGFFHVEVLAVLFGSETARIFYCVFGFCGIYGVHLMIDHTKKEWGLK